MCSEVAADYSDGVLKYRTPDGIEGAGSVPGMAHGGCRDGLIRADKVLVSFRCERGRHRAVQRYEMHVGARRCRSIARLHFGDGTKRGAVSDSGASPVVT